MPRQDIFRAFIYSAGGFGREVAWLTQSAYADGGAVELKFIEDNPSKIGGEVNGIGIISYAEASRMVQDWKLINAIGNPLTRRKVTEKCLRDGFRFATITHPSCQISKHNHIGPGCIFCAGVIVTVNVGIGRNCNFNLNSTVGHDCKIGDFVSVAPGANIAGCVNIGDEVYVGTGASIINGTQDNPLVIGKGAVIGAGAVVIRDVRPGATVVGIPAREI